MPRTHGIKNMPWLPLTTKAAGQANDENLFYPWGQAWVGGSSEWNYAAFDVGRDSATGFYPTPNRQYNPSPGRWMSPDPGNAGGEPTDPQTWNMYAYARNNPTTFTDPTGERYQICQTDASGNSNCADISDADWSQFEEDNKNTLTFAGNSIYQNGTLIGTSQQTSVDATPGLMAVGTGSQMAAPIVKPLFALTMAFILNVGPATFLDSLVMPVPLGPSMNGKTVPDILQGATPEGGSRTDIYSKPGGFPQAQQDFNDLGGGQAADQGSRRG